MLWEGRSVEEDQCIGDERGIVSQFEHGSRDAAPRASQVEVGAMSSKLADCAHVLKFAPENQPSLCDRGDLDKAAVILPDEGKTGFGCMHL